MDVTFLESFLAVVKHGSIAEAARRLNMAPSSVAQRLKSLEAEFGKALVTRSGRTVRATTVGSHMIYHAEQVIRDMEKLKAAASDTALPAGPLRLGSTPTGLVGYVPALLKRWVSNYPTIEVFIDPGPTAVLYEKVLAEELDAAMLVHPPFSLPKVCKWLTFGVEELILLTPKKLKVKNPLQTVAEAPYIWYDRNAIAGKQAVAYLEKHGIRPQGRFELDDISTIARLVGEGLGVSVLPDWATTGPQDSATVRWALPAPVPSRAVGMIWRHSATRAGLVEAFLPCGPELRGG